MSQFFEWDPATLSVHVPAMDRDHQRIIACMNKLHAEVKSKAGAGALAKSIEELAAVTVKHFADEEVYMESIAYPGLANHRIIHKSLLAKFQEHRERFQKSGKLDDEFFQFLRHWLKAHICGIDVKYGQHARAA